MVPLRLWPPANYGPALASIRMSEIKNFVTKWFVNSVDDFKQIDLIRFYFLSENIIIVHK